MLQVKAANFDFLTLCCYISIMPGRPKKPEETKSYMLRIRMTEEDRALLEEAAKTRSLETSTWARSELVTIARKIIKQSNPTAT